MSDLISRIIFLENLGNSEPKERIDAWLYESENNPFSEFNINNEKFYWSILSSKKFLDLINEDETDWVYIHSENKDFKVIFKIQSGFENLIGETNKINISTIWILKSDIESLKINEKPILIWTPHHFDSSHENIDYDLKKLIIKLQNPKIKITQFVEYNISKKFKKRIR